MSGTLQVPTTGTVSGLQNNQDINVALQMLATANQGGSAPTTGITGLASVAGVIWHDTTNSLIKVRDQADTAWIPIGSIDETNKAFIPYYRNAALPGYLHGALFGCTLSNDGVAPNTKIDIAAGFWVDDTAAFAVTPGALAIDFTTNGAGGLDTGALAASTWYHCFEI